MLRRILPIATLACLLAADRSLAQTGHQARSLEWLAARSEVIVRATPAVVERTPITDSEEEIRRDPRVRKRVVLTVHETLKGDRVESLTFIDEHLASDQIYEAWSETGQEQLWFLVRIKEPESEGPETAPRFQPFDAGRSIIRLAACGESGPALPEERGFTPFPPPIFRMNLDLPETPDDLLNATRAAVAEAVEPALVQSHDIMLPREIMMRSGTSGDVNHLTVPVDHRLEAVAQRWITSPGDVLADGEGILADGLRLEGVKALRYFPSERNAALLRSLLDDPASRTRTTPSGAKEKVFFIREAADRILRSWDADVDGLRRKPLPADS